MSDTGSPTQAGVCLNCGGPLYHGLSHRCSTTGKYDVPLPASPPRELYLHIHKDGKTASTVCPPEGCLFGKRIRYVLAEGQ